MSLLSTEEATFLHLVLPLDSSTGEDAPIGLVLYVRERLSKGDGTPEHREWVSRMAKKLGLAA